MFVEQILCVLEKVKHTGSDICWEYLCWSVVQPIRDEDAWEGMTEFAAKHKTYGVVLPHPIAKAKLMPPFTLEENELFTRYCKILLARYSNSVRSKNVNEWLKSNITIPHMLLGRIEGKICSIFVIWHLGARLRWPHHELNVFNQTDGQNRRETARSISDQRPRRDQIQTWSEAI